MYLYIPVKKKLLSPEYGRYSTVGLYAFHITTMSCCMVASVDDVSPCFCDVLILAFRCTIGQLRPYQLKDIVEDYLLD